MGALTFADNITPIFLIGRILLHKNSTKNNMKTT